MDFDGIGFYPTAMTVKKPIYPEKETGFALTRIMNDNLVHAFNNGSYTKMKRLSYPRRLQSIRYNTSKISDMEKMGNIEPIRMRSGDITATLKSNVFQDIVQKSP